LGLDCEIECWGLVATRNRQSSLMTMSLPSIVKQKHPLTSLLLVNDGDPWAKTFTQQVCDLLRPIPFVFMENSRTEGVAGAWNTGIEWLSVNHPNTWIAILDDDDHWDSDHIEVCLDHVGEGVGAVISGLRTIKGSDVVSTGLTSKVSVQDFLRGNPGWQGSNTFMRTAAFLEIGMFDENLICTHDRDLAVRFLSDDSFSCSITGKATATFYLGIGRETLTTGSQKKDGLLQFWNKHKGLMSEEDAEAFKDRSLRYFGVEPAFFRPNR